MLINPLNYHTNRTCMASYDAIQWYPFSNYYHCLKFLTLLSFSLCTGGAGGKGTWGKPTDFFDEEGGHVKDIRDPNYDSDEADVSNAQ